jgi:ATP:corrinoid adenosyltransferase
LPCGRQAPVSRYTSYSSSRREGAANITAFPDLVTINSTERVLKRKANTSDINAAGKGLEEVKMLRSGSIDLLILDEVNIAVSRGLISRNDLLEVMDMKPNNLELLLTGSTLMKK